MLGPVVAWDAGERIALKGPRHRAVLARLIVARGEVVSVARLVDDLWPEPPPRAVGAVRTFVSDLRRALGPTAPRARGRTAGRPRAPGTRCGSAGAVGCVAVRGGGRRGPSARRAAAGAAARGAVAGGAGRPSRSSTTRTGRCSSGAGWRSCACSRWRPWRTRGCGIGRAGEAVADLDAHVAAHPWREEGWRLLALALAGSGRRGDALNVLRRAHGQLAEQLGVEPGEPLRRLQQDLLHGPSRVAAGVDAVWAQAAAAYDREVGARSKARLESTVGLLRSLAVTGGGGLTEARTHRLAAIAAAEELGDPLLTARVIGAYDVPAIWTRSDDPEQAAAIVAAARRALQRRVARRRAGTAAGHDRARVARRLRAPRPRRARPNASPAISTTPRCSRSRSTACGCSRSSAAASPRAATRSARSCSRSPRATACRRSRCSAT